MDLWNWSLSFQKRIQNVLLRLINQHHQHTKEKVVNKLLHKWKTSGRFSNIMRKSEESTKTSWYNFVNKVKDLLSPKQKGKSNCWHKCCKKNKVRVKNYIENFKEIFERVKSWNYKCRCKSCKNGRIRNRIQRAVW